MDMSTFSNTRKEFVEDELELTSLDKTIMLNAFETWNRLPDNSTIGDDYDQAQNKYPGDSSFIALIRPPKQITSQILPYMGIARHKAGNMGLKNLTNTFNEFYRTELISHNPYASNFCALYNQRYMNSHSKIGDTGIVITLNKRGFSTSSLGTFASRMMEEAYNIDEAYLSTLNESQATAFSNMVPQKSLNSRLKYPQKQKLPLQQVKHHLLGPQHVIARLGYSIPMTCYTSYNLLRETYKAYTDVFSSRTFPGEYVILSPYRALKTRFFQ